MKQKIGVVVGRFQPLHAGHVRLIQRAFAENERVKIVIGSSQIAAPLSVEERERRMCTMLQTFGIDAARYEIFVLPDIHNLPFWPTYVKQQIGLSDDTENYYYTGEYLDVEFQRYLEAAGFIVVVGERDGFIYIGPDGRHYIFRSATEIRALHERLGAMDKL